MEWLPVIGLEIHVELATATKMFCGCANQNGAEPNTLVCPMCAGLPGAMPSVNSEAVRLSVLAGKALHCKIHAQSRFDRKHYFYPDLPKGYQITQFFHPFCEGGELRFRFHGEWRKLGITRIHMEEDAGKLFHEDRKTVSELNRYCVEKTTNLRDTEVHSQEETDGKGFHAYGMTLLDMNRCGVPLIEIVTKPELHSGEEAAEAFRAIRRLLMFNKVTKGRMNEGNLRCDVNLSLHRAGEGFGTRCEIKNLNSFSSVEKACKAEIARQRRILEAGGVIEQMTLRFDGEKTHPMRKKETISDYRYMEEPDLPWLFVDKNSVAKAISPNDYIEKWSKQADLAYEDGERLTASKEAAEAFDQCCVCFNGASRMRVEEFEPARASGVLQEPKFFSSSIKVVDQISEGETVEIDAEPIGNTAFDRKRNEKLPPKEAETVRAAAHLIIGELAALCEGIGNEEVFHSSVDYSLVREIAELQTKGRINATTAKKLISVYAGAETRSPEQYCEDMKLTLIRDEAVILGIAKKVVAQNSAMVEQYRKGKVRVMAALVGKGMALCSGRCDARLLEEKIKEMIHSASE